MLLTSKKRRATSQNLMLVLIIVISLVIAPNSFFDPINVPKMSLLLVIISAIAMLKPSFFYARRKLSSRIQNLSYSILLIFICYLLFSLILHRESFPERLFGIYGRNTGVLSYICLALLTIVFLVQKELNLKRIVDALAISNSLVVIYYLLQRFDLDPYVFQNLWSSPSSFLGNPNFVSSFLGFSSLAYFQYLNRCYKWKILSLIAMLASTLIILDSDSIQGLFVLLSCLVTYFLSSRRVLKSKRLFVPCILSTIFFGVMISLGLFGEGPFRNFLRSETLLVRAYYWKVALKMWLDRPITGFGLDNFGSFYRFYGAQVNSNGKYDGLYTDVAHNVSLDILVGLGIVGFLLYTSMQVLVFVNSIKNIGKMSDSKERALVRILFGAWIGFTFQSFISINQIGLAVWGWTLSGILMRNLVSQELANSIKKNHSQNGEEINKKYRFLLTTALRIAGLLLFIVTFQFYKVESRFFDAASQQNGNKMLEIVNQWPQNSQRFLILARALASANQNSLSLLLAENGAERFPNSYELWQIIEATAKEDSWIKQKARDRMLALNPRAHFEK